MGYLFTILALCFALATAESPAVSKQYRSDYTYDKNTDSFYKMHTEQASTDRAHTTCQAEGARLMAPESEQDLALIHGMFKKFPDIGRLVLVDGNGAGHDEADEDEEPIINLEGETDFDSRRKCEVVNREGQIESSICYFELPFICKVNAKDAPYNEECGTYSNDYVSKISLTGSCYRIARIKANWNEAYANCQAEGAHLAILNNEGEFEIVKGLIEKIPRSVEDWQFFVGVRAEEKKSPIIFKTVFNQTLEQVGYAPWDNNEPNNSFGIEYCVSLIRTTCKYNDTVCRNRYSYICEKERSV
ncbi:secretory phospholipase A2 receptor-like isoform X3 [Leguminivora glycinivorella]|uniref:secretory phospholipase A2 receptor-like isoform X3 n=1 Tax=Leguminivora glycinivorella TaxID=1035111 RepID=UPI00200CEACF|nr:secretory phospholipase A2 receptor-like isoform X3 [Leguminivora glycinivorella]